MPTLESTALSPHRRHVTLCALSVSVGGMATDDHSGSGESGENGPRRTAESADISERLQELARQLGITQAELARMTAAACVA